MSVTIFAQVPRRTLIAASLLLGFTASPLLSQAWAGKGESVTEASPSDEPVAMDDVLSVPDLPDEQFAAVTRDTVVILPGYIDSAVPLNQIRFRLDASYDFLQPDRAEFFYAACGCAGGPGPGGPGVNPTVNSNVDSLDYSVYLESARSDWFSWFVELPFRSIDPASNVLGGVPTLNTGSSSGLGDLTAGFKYSLFADCDQHLTFQLRAFAPTGDADRGLGTNHVSLEPALLYQNQYSDRLTLFAELRDWIPIGGFQLGGADFSGNILRYGVGAGYTLHDSCDWRVTPMVEMVGWTIFNGQMTDTPVAVTGAEGTIVNVKAGARIRRHCGIGGLPNTMYIGYGRALTGDTWYQDIARFEYSILF